MSVSVLVWLVGRLLTLHPEEGSLGASSLHSSLPAGEICRVIYITYKAISTNTNQLHVNIANCYSIKYNHVQILEYYKIIIN